MKAFLLAGVMFALGLGVGRVFLAPSATPSSGSASSAAPAPPTPAQNAVAPPTTSRPAGGKSDVSPEVADFTPAASLAEAMTQWRTAQASSDPIKRARQLLAVIDLITPENMDYYVEGWKATIREYRSLEGLAVMVNRAFGRVGAATLTAERKGDERDMLGVNSYVRQEILGWMESDPAAVKQWIDGLENEAFRDAVIPAYLEGLIPQAPDKILDAVNALPADLQPRTAVRLVTNLRETLPMAQVDYWLTSVARTAGTEMPPWIIDSYHSMMGSALNARAPGPEVAALYEAHADEPWVAQWGTPLAQKYAANHPDDAIPWLTRLASAKPANFQQLALPFSDAVPLTHAPQALQALRSLPKDDVTDLAISQLEARVAASETPK